MWGGGGEAVCVCGGGGGAILNLDILSHEADAATGLL